MTETVIAPTDQLTIEKATLRTPEDVAADEASGILPPASPGGAVPFRPAMSIDEYNQAKAAAAATNTGVRNAPLALVAPTLKGVSIEGVNETTAGGFFPPDTHGAVGKTQFVEVTNVHLDVFNKTSPFTKVRSVSLPNFLGYFAAGLSDPRVVYDPIWNRWVITVLALPESTTVQRLFIAVSTTSDATGSFFIFNIDVDTLNNNDFFDFPQLGINQDAVIITGNIFGANGALKYAEMFAIAKARLYNGLGFSFPIFTNLCSTLAPPIVLDQRAKAFLVCAPPSGSTIKKYTLTNASNGFDATLTGPINITVPSYSVPPDAAQCGTTQVLDTSDARFENASTQIGSSLFQVHTIDSPAAPKFYEFNTTTNTVIQSGFFFKSKTSDDWNASIVANASKDVYVTWSATDVGASPCTNAQVRFSGRLSTDPAGVIGSGSALFTSSTALTGNFDPNFGAQRWGDYSAVTIDPTNSSLAWFVNEKINSASVWGSRIGDGGF